MTSEKMKKNAFQQFDTTQEFSIDAIENPPAQPAPNKSEEEIRLLRDALTESKKCYQAMLETNLYGIMEMDVNGVVIFMNPVMGRILGYDLEDVKGKVIYEILASDAEKEKLKNHFSSLSGGSRPFFPWTGQFKRKDGKPLELKIDWNFRRDRLGRIIGFVSVISDVIAPAPAESPLSMPAADNYQILEVVQELILICDLEGNIAYINTAGADLLGFYTDELLEMNMVDILPPEHLESIKKNLLDPKADNDGQRENLFTVDLMNRDMKLVTIEISASLMRKKGIPSEIFIIARDITHRRRIERELFKNVKFDAISLFANGIVQDFHDYLTSVIGNIDFAQMILDPEGNVYKKLSEAKEGCTKMKDLTRQFVVFSGGGTPMKQPGSIEDIIRKAADDAVKDSDVRYELNIADDLWDIAFDAKQMELAIYNVVLNAVEASPQRGVIVIGIDNLMIGAGQDELVATMKEGKYIRIAVQNSGPGISPDAVDLIFDPYFSTKRIRAKRGQGLGLTLSYSIIKRHHGYITVEAKPNIKTTFFLMLPASRREMRDKTRISRHSFKGKILLTDDEEPDASLAGDIIRRMGYQAESVRSGEQAVAEYAKAKDSDKPFDTVIMSIKMRSGMNAAETMKNLRRIDPGIKGIISGSYPNDPEMNDYQKYGFTGKLDKPYNKDEMRTVIEAVTGKK